MSNVNFKMSRLGVDLGVVWGVNLMLMAWFVMLFNVGAPVVALFATFYMGYAATFVGGLVGLIFGFVHGYVLGMVTNFVMKFVKK